MTVLLQAKNLHITFGAVKAANGVDLHINEGEFLAFIRLKHGPGDQVRLTLLRGGQKLDLDVPMW